jgi:hypothetical protein
MHAFSLAKFELQPLFRGGRAHPPQEFVRFLYLLQLSACKKMPFLEFLPVASVPFK